MKDLLVPMDAVPAMALGDGFDCLAGIRVLDLSTSVAGPFATMMLGDMGAEVLKVERPPAGDDTRAWGPPFLDGESLWFLSINRNKHSLRLDYSEPAGLQVLRDLMHHSDVVVVNQPARVSARFGVDAKAVHAVKGDLIYVSITGFGLNGRRSDWTCYDLIAEGYSGVMDLTGEPDGPPQKVGAPAADMIAGQDAAFAIVAALFKRMRTGLGGVIDIALVDSMIRFLTCEIVPYLGSGEPRRRSGGRKSVIAVYQAFDTADDPMTLALGNDKIWGRFWEAVGAPELGNHPAYGSNSDRRARRAEIVVRIQQILRTRPRAEWLEVFRLARVPAGPINRIDEVAADGEFHRRGLLYRLDAAGRRMPQVGTGFQLDGEPNRPRRAPPRFGEHTKSVLTHLLGYENDRIERLAAAGVI